MHFHVRYVTFKCCVNYLLARRLWEKPTTDCTNNRSRMARETMLFAVRDSPNAANCRLQHCMHRCKLKIKKKLMCSVMSAISTYHVSGRWLQLESGVRRHGQHIRISTNRRRREKWWNFRHNSLVVFRLIVPNHLHDDISRQKPIIRNDAVTWWRENKNMWQILVNEKNK